MPTTRRPAAKRQQSTVGRLLTRQATIRAQPLSLLLRMMTAVPSGPVDTHGATHGRGGIAHALGGYGQSSYGASSYGR